MVVIFQLFDKIRLWIQKYSLTIYARINTSRGF
jgi:hypothetical protein